ncbi:hypothetical protein CRG98_025274 [Punica granatum]|uniref:Protein Lines N-terminal domain-containing protein n=1 Tax=Punica granatum TaxID=22663 RepID=A0A2I0JDL1_PUNGR|nr:hypothetical protein CRG98_025274 [Punica granatum]
MEEDFLLHVSDVFNPITIFHIFLAEIHYDHQVLLDYLISKDTGISCAQYLLRCLRMILDKFEAFLEFQVDDFTEEPSSKRRKPSMQGRNELADVSSLLPRVKHLDGDHVNGYKNQKIRGQPFEEAKRMEAYWNFGERTGAAVFQMRFLEVDRNKCWREGDTFTLLRPDVEEAGGHLPPTFGWWIGVGMVWDCQSGGVLASLLKDVRGPSCPVSGRDG